MIVDVEVPNQGLTITEATLTRWVKRVGETIQADEIIFEIETDKAVQEIECPVSGTILAHLAEAGDIVPLGRVVAKVGTEATDRWQPDEPPALTAVPLSLAPTLSNSRRVSLGSGPAPASRPVASPRARRTAERIGIDVATVEATGGGGLHIRERDVLQAAASRPKMEEAIMPEPIAARSNASYPDIPSFYLTRQLNVDGLMDFHKNLLKQIGSSADIQIDITDFVVKALAIAITKHPSINCRWQDGSIAPQESVDIGTVVVTPNGQAIPVVRSPAQRSLMDIARQRIKLMTDACEGNLTAENLCGGSFTLSDRGLHGVDQFQATISSSQCGTLAMGSIQRRPFTVDEKLDLAYTVCLTLSLDQRVVDAAEGAAFLDTLCSCLTRPYMLAGSD